MQQRADLRGLPVPEAFARELLISTDDWDGMPNRRTELLAQVQNVDNLVAVTGDLHSFFAGSTGTPFGDRVIEFMCGAVSSATYRSILEGAGFSVPGLDLGVAAGLLLEAANPHMAYEELLSNGFAEVEVSASALRVTFHQIPFDELRQQKLAGNFDQHFHTERFRVKAGSARIERDFDGAWKHWDEASKSWV
jgi:alkaline phosphatase D